MSPPLLLASTSPRRARLLQDLGLPFVCVDPGVDDSCEEGLVRAAQTSGRPAPWIVERLAFAKLVAGLRHAAPDQVVLAADTAVAYEGVFLGKAPSREHARATLWDLRARTHEVHTGVALATPHGVRGGVATSRVRFRAFDEEALETFLDTDAWRGKAGAYGVQDPESTPLVEEVVGSRSNVIGLPLELVQELLAS